MSDTDAPEDGIRRQALGAMGVAVLARKGNGSEGFVEIEPMPGWWAGAFGSAAAFRDRSPFMEDFTGGAASEYWATTTGKTGAPLHSGIWEEPSAGEATGESESPRFFEAIACRGDQGDALLIVVPADDRWHREQGFVQSVHDQSLSRRRLGIELEKKQVLLECIMHDLGNPLATVLTNLRHIRRELGDRDAALKPALRRAIDQAERQQELTRSIAEVFAADLAGAKRDREEGNTLDLMAVAAETVAACAPAATENGVALCPFFSESLVVVCDPLPLSRVIENLLLNAIRHSPKGGSVLISFEKDGAFAVCQVEDNGPGIDAEVSERLFDPFSHGAASPEQSGLGLYFCRMTIEMWGGAIAGKNRPEGGACFEFRLPLAKEAKKETAGEPS